MSDMRIKGGRRDRAWIIDEQGRGQVLSIGHDAAFQHSLEGGAYTVLTEVDLTDANLTPISWLQNNDEQVVNGDKRLLYVDNLIVSADANVHLEVFIAEGYTSGGTDRIPLNMLVGSTSEAPVVVKGGTGTALVLDGAGTEVQSLFIGANTAPTHHVGLFLPKSKTLAVKAQGANTNKVRVEMTFFFVTPPSD